MCFQRENIDVTWGVTWEPGRESVHHYMDQNILSMAQGMVQALRAGKHLRHVIGSDGVVQFHVSPLRPYPIDALWAKTVFLEEENHRCKERVASSRSGFQEEL